MRNTPYKTMQEHGFTLVELAIGMLIIGLLIGGALKGQELVQNARVASTVSQIKTIDSATLAFMDRFNAYPGDMNTAEIRLPRCIAPPCLNGNGDGRLGRPIFDNVHIGAGTSGQAGAEGQYFFGHLYAADLVTGVNGTLEPTLLTWGHSYPATAMGGGLVAGRGDTLADFTAPDGVAPWGGTPPPGHYLSIRLVPMSTVGYSGSNRSLTTSLAARIDRKMDDGAPGSGVVIAPQSSSKTGVPCGLSAAEYNERNNATSCDLYIRMQK